MDNKEQLKKTKIFRMLKSLEDLPNVTVTRPPTDYKTINIEHPLEFVPNLRLEYCDVKKHYRVYILVASTTYIKVNAGYTICTIGSPFAAAGLVMFYGFLHKHRPHNRNDA